MSALLFDPRTVEARIRLYYGITRIWFTDRDRKFAAHVASEWVSGNSLFTKSAREYRTANAHEIWRKRGVK